MILRYEMKRERNRARRWSVSRLAIGWLWPVLLWPVLLLPVLLWSPWCRTATAQDDARRAETTWFEQAGAAQRLAGDVQARRFVLTRGSDRIALHRYAKRGEPTTTAKAKILLYLPGTNMNGEVALGDQRHNLWLFLAARGVTVYALDYRSHFIAASTTNFAPMAAWTTDVYVNDALRALALVREQHADAQIFVAGFSRGVTIAYGLICTAGAGSLAGLIALDGGFKRPPGAAEFPSGAARAPAD